MMSRKYTPEQIEFVRENVAGRRYADLAELFNKRFGTAYSAKQLSSLANYLKTGNGLRRNRVSEEEIQFIRENLPGRSFNETAKLLEERFGGSFDKYQVRHISRKLKIATGIIPSEGLPVNTERIHKHSGYIYVKTASGEWKSKHVFIWEAANEPVPKDSVVIFADGDNRNFAPDNLLLVSKKELILANRLKLLFPNGNLTRSAMLAVKLRLLLNEKSGKNGKSREKRKEKKHEN
jgi:hypothetical protein